MTQELWMKTLQEARRELQCLYLILWMAHVLPHGEPIERAVFLAHGYVK